MEQCVSDFEGCAPTELCFRDVSWLPDGVKSACGCSTAFGWSGPDCDGVSYSVMINIIMALSILVLALLGFGYNVRALRRFFKLRNKGDRRWDPSSVTVLFVLITLFSIVSSRLCTLVVLYTPQFNDLRLDSTNKKQHRADPAEKTFLGLASVFGMLALLNVAIVWIDIARKSARMVNTGATIWGGFAKYVYAFEFAFFAVIIGASTQASTELAAMLSLPFIAAIGVLYLVGLRKLGKILEMMGADLAAFSASPNGSPGAAAAASAASAANRKSLRRSRELSPTDSGSTLGDASSSFARQDTTDDLESADAADAGEADSKESMALPGDRTSMVYTALSSVGRAATKTLNRVRTRSLDKKAKRERELQRRNEYYTLLTKVQYTAYLVFFNGCLLFTATTINAVTGFWIGVRELCTPDSTACVVTVSLECISLFLLGTVVAVSQYVYDNARVRKRRRKTLMASALRTATGADSASTDRRSLRKSGAFAPSSGSGDRSSLRRSQIVSTPPDLHPALRSPGGTSFFDGESTGHQAASKRSSVPLRRPADEDDISL